MRVKQLKGKYLLICVDNLSRTMRILSFASERFARAYAKHFHRTDYPDWNTVQACNFEYATTMNALLYPMLITRIIKLDLSSFT